MLKRKEREMVSDVEVSPELALWNAVLEQAILDRCGPGYLQLTEKERSDLDQWFLEWDGGEYRRAFSFAWICEQLDLDPMKILESIKGLKLTPHIDYKKGRGRTKLLETELLLNSRTATELDVYHEDFYDGHFRKKKKTDFFAEGVK